MTDPDRITLYYSPQTRATGARILLEELGAPYDLHVLNMKAGEQRQPAYLAVNPLGKVPAIRHGEALVTEQVAITIYLAELFPQAGLTPALNDPLRGPYLRWIAYYGASFEPGTIADSSISPLLAACGDRMATDQLNNRPMSATTSPAVSPARVQNSRALANIPPLI